MRTASELIEEKLKAEQEERASVLAEAIIKQREAVGYAKEALEKKTDRLNQLEKLADNKELTEADLKGLNLFRDVRIS